jgi:hypothetical protein
VEVGFVVASAVEVDVERGVPVGLAVGVLALLVAVARLRVAVGAGVRLGVDVMRDTLVAVARVDLGVCGVSDGE